MSGIKEMKENPNNTMSIVDILSFINGGDVQNKYYELFIKVIDKKISENFSDRIKEVAKLLVTKFPGSEEKVKGLSNFNIAVITSFFDLLDDAKIDIEVLEDFIKFNEKHAIVKNDVTSYVSYDEVLSEVNSIRFKEEEKSLEKQVHKLYDSDEWVVLKPLTWKSALKYGAGTKWCTSMENQQTYFDKYTKNGILIYILNKKTNHKVAYHEDITSNNGEITLWNATDQKIEAFNSGVPFELLSIINDDRSKNRITNKALYEKNPDKGNEAPKKVAIRKKAKSPLALQNNVNNITGVNNGIPAEFEQFFTDIPENANIDRSKILEIKNMLGQLTNR